MSEEDFQEAVSLAKELMNKKADIEKQIENLQIVLETQKIGMSEPLVDAEGFPRNDVDVYLVRTTRAQIIRLQNDFKEIMRQIEEQLVAVHKLHKQVEPMGSVNLSNTPNR